MGAISRAVSFLPFIVSSSSFCICVSKSFAPP
jgi:hypothetical protein